jgi:glycosyltransferase involved in cell wall biosynthesis
MRIVQLTDAPVPSDLADSMQVVRMAAAFGRAGHDVTLHAWRGAPDADLDRVVRDYAVTPTFALALHGAHADPVSRRAAAGRGGLSRLLWALRRAVALVGGVRRALVDERPDLVFARSLLAQPLVPRGVDLIIETHQPPRTGFAGMLEGRGLARARRVVVISGPLADAHLARRPELADRLVVAHDAADDPGPADAVAAVLPPTDRLRVGHVGHLYPGRGVEVLVHLAERLPDVELHLVGGTPADVGAIVASGVPDNLVVHGFRPPRELPGFYAAMDVLVAPYQRRVMVAGGVGDTSAWMSPMKLFEYLSWGRAIVFSDLPVVHEVLEHDVDALLVTPDDLGAWVAAIARLRDDPALIERLGRGARATFLAGHTWDARVARILDGLDGADRRDGAGA